jgi:uncharacterized Zn finger protein (UPF0148 family)
VVIVCASCGWAFVIWVRRKAGENKKLIEQTKKTEEERAKNTKLVRDQQNKETNDRIDDVAKRLDDHINADKLNEEKMQKSIDKTSDRLDKMNEMVRDMKDSMIMKQEFSIFAQTMTKDFSGLNSRFSEVREMMISIDATLKERARHEHKE